MNRLAYKFRLCVLMMSALFASCAALSTPYKVTKGYEQFAFKSVVNPGILHSTKEDAMASLSSKVSPDLEILKYSERQAMRDTATGWYVVENTPIITGGDLEAVRARQADSGGGYQIAFRLNPKGTEKFREWTKANSGATVAIVLDGVVVSAAVVRSEISNAEMIMEVNFTKEEAENLSAKLRGN